MFGIKKMFIKKTQAMILYHKKETEHHLKNLSLFGESYKESLGYEATKLGLAWLDLKITFLKAILNI